MTLNEDSPSYSLDLSLKIVEADDNGKYDSKFLFLPPILDIAHSWYLKQQFRITFFYDNI